MRSTSALAYFFGRNIQEELDVPVGIIVAAWGGNHRRDMDAPRMRNERPGLVRLSV